MCDRPYNGFEVLLIFLHTHILTQCIYEKGTVHDSVSGGNHEKLIIVVWRRCQSILMDRYCRERKIVRETNRKRGGGGERILPLDNNNGID
jgi:hypothetical protein